MAEHRTGLGYDQRKEVEQLLRGVARSDGDDKATRVCIYNEGWDDERVAAAVPFPCTRHNVARMRAKELGRLRAKEPAPPAPAVDLAAALRLLTERHEALAHRVTRLERALNMPNRQARFDFDRKGGG